MRRGVWAVLTLTALAGASACTPDKPAAEPAALVLDSRIPLGAVKGRIDHLAIDLQRRRLFVAELGAGAVEAVDLGQGRSLGRIGGLKEPQGLAYLPGRDELAVASGGDGSVRFYRASDLSPLGAVQVGDDADNLRVDAAGRIVVGYGSGALAIIDPASRRIVAELKLPAHPEGFRLAGDLAFINLPNARQIVVGNLAQHRILASWPAAYGWNFPMALDEAKGTLAVVFRLPARLQLLATDTGKVKLDRGACGDADDAFFDVRRHRAYVVCGSGALDVVDLDHPELSTRIKTRSGARTGLFVPELDRLFVAARAEGGDAAVLVYRPMP